MHSLKNYILIILLFVFFQDQTIAQLCGCTACPVDVPVGGNAFVSFEISGATTNTDLAGSQAVCGVAIQFNPTNILGIEMTLSSPGGQSVQLIGPTAIGSGSVFTTFDIAFVQCGDNAIPEPGFTAQWNNAQLWPINGNIMGTYYPFSGCLESFNMGSVNGNWVLTVNNNNTNPPTDFPLVIENFYPIFCEDVGIDCDPCDADAGDLSSYPDLQVCEGDPELSMEINPVYPGSAPDPAAHFYRFAIGDLDSNNEIIEYQSTFDISDYEPGSYTICGFSILQSDVGNLGPFFPPDGMVTLGDLNIFLMGINPPVCGDLTDDCFEIDIFPVPNEPVIAFPDTIPCSGSQSILLNGTLPPGNPPFTWSAYNGGSFGAGQNTLTPEVLTPGNYVLEVMFPSSICAAADTVEVFADTNTPNISIATPDSLGCDNGSVVLNGSGTTGASLSFEWFDVATGNSISMTSTASVTEAGTYLLVATSGVNNCADSLEVEVFGSAQVPIAIAPLQDTLSCNETSVLLDGTMSTGGTIYEWYNSSGTLIAPTSTFTVTMPDVYELIVTNSANNCKDTTYTTIIESADTPTAIVLPPDTLNCTIDLVTLIGNTSTSNNPVEYCWLNPNGDIIGLSENHQVSIAGVFELVVKDQVSGCTDTTEIEVIKIDAVPTALPTPQGFLNCQQDEVYVDALSSFGINDLTYEWYSGFWVFIDNTDSILVNNTDFYNLLVIDEITGCVDSIRFSVLQDTISPIANAVTNDMISCFNTEALLDGSGSSFENNGIFEWFDPDGNSVSTIATYNTSLVGQHLLVTTDTVNFCVDSMFVAVPGDTSSVVAVAFPDTLDCVQTEVILDGNASIGPSNMLFEWQDFSGATISNTATHLVTVPDTYRLIVSIPNSTCTDTIEIEIPQIIVQPEISVTTDPGTVLDCNNPTILAEAFVIGGFTWHNSDWDTVAQTNDYLITAPGTYYFVGESNSTFCLDTVELIITDNFNYPNAVAIALDTITCTQDSVILNGSGSSGQGPLGYQWYDPINTPLGMSPTQVAYNAGTYTLVVENLDFGCTDTVEVVVNQVADVPVAVIDSIGFLDCGGSTLMLDGSNSMSTGPLAYEWVNQINMTVVSQTAIANITAAGIYELTITDLNSNCESSTSIVINNTAQPTSTIAFPDTISCGMPTIDLIGAASLGIGNLSYTWLNDMNGVIGMTQDIVVNQGGVYTLVIGHELNACTDTSTIEVIENLVQPTASGGTSDFITCFSPFAVMTPMGSSGIGGLDFEWLDPMGNFVGDSALEIAMIPGNYTLIVTDNENSCKDTAAIVVPGNIEPPIAVAGATGVGCDASQIFMSGSNSTGQGTLGYLWQDSFGIFIGNNIVESVDSIATYFLVVTDDANGCADTTSLTVPESGLGINAIATVSNELDCTNSSAILDGSMSVADNFIFYEWYDPSNVAFANSPLVPVSESGIYQLIIFDQLSGCTDTTTVEVIQSANSVRADIQTSGSGVINCKFPTIQLDGSNSSGDNLTYLWRDLTGITLFNEPVYEVSDPNFYWLVVTDTLTSCTDSVSLIVSLMQDTPEAVAVVQDTINCFQNSVLMDGTGSFSPANHEIEFQWYNDMGIALGNDNTQLASSPGIYELIVTDTLTACADTAFVEVFQSSDQPNSVITFDNHLNCINETATLDGSLSSIAGRWTDGSFTDLGTSPMLPVTSPGIYYLILQDDSSMCSDTAGVEIFQYLEEPNAVAQIDLPYTCISDTIILDGTSSSTTGSTLIYEWQNGGASIGNASTELAFSLDTYTLIVTDSLSGCVDSMLVTPVVDTIPPIANAVVFDSLSCALDSVLITGNPLPTDANYEWRNSANQIIGTTIDVMVGDPGLYGFMVTNNLNGCTDSISVEVFSNDNNVNAFVAFPDSLGCGIEFVTLDGSNSVGTDLIYTWKDASGMVIDMGAMTDVTTVGEYTLVVTDQNMTCADSTSVEVFSGGGSIISNISFPDSLGCGIEFVTLDGSNSVGADLIYTWKDASGMVIDMDAMTDVTAVGEYTLVVSDQNMTCIDSMTVEVFSGGGSIISNISFPDSLGCWIEFVTLDGSNSVGADLIYTWKDASGMVIDMGTMTDVTAVGEYTLVVSDQNMTCIDSTSVEVFSGGGSIISNISFPDSLGCGIEFVTLDGSNSVGADLIYTWKDASGMVIDMGTMTDVTAVGGYTLVVSDQNMTCIDSTTVEVFSGGGSIVAAATASGDFDCETAIISLDASGSSTDVTYLWKNENEEIIGGMLTTNVTAPGNYTLIITSFDGSCIDSTTVEVGTNPGDLNPVAIADGSLSCENGEVLLDGSSSIGATNLLFEWQNASNNIISQNASTNVSDPGIYTLYITSENLVCIDSTEVEVFQDAGSVIANGVVLDTLTCSVSIVNLDGSGSTGGAVFFEWFDPNGQSISMSAMANTNQPGVHKLVVSGADQSCIDSTNVEVFGRFEFPTTVIAPFDPLTCSDDTIQLDATPSIGIGSLGYNWFADDWSLLSFGPTYNAMNEGLYYAVVTDADTGCADTLQVNVEAEFDAPMGMIEVQGGFDCDSDQALLIGTSTTEPVTYQWFDNATNSLLGVANSQEIFNPGTYYLVLTNPNNECTDTTFVEVNDSGASVQAVTNAAGTIDCNTMSVMISGEGSSTGNDVVYTWYNPQNNMFSNQLNEMVNDSGEYWLVVSNGICADTSYLNVIDESGILPDAIISGPDTLTINCGDQLILDGSTTLVNDTLIATWSPMSSINTFADAEMLQPIVGTTGWLYLSVLNTNSGCVGIDSLLIQSFETTISAGSDTLICGDDFMLNAELPINSTGLWTLPDGIEMDDITSPNGIITGMQAGQFYNLIWTISADGCTDYATAAVQISVDEAPTAVDDDFEFEGGFGPFNFDILANDQLFQSDDIYNIISEPASGMLNDDGTGELGLDFGSLFSGALSFEYNLCNNICPNLCDTALVAIQIDSLDITTIDVDIPNAITPNDDGINDVLIIDFILAEPDKYPDSELLIFNRWGDVVYRAKPYQNNWDGTNKLGLPLPDGTYYYLLNLDLQNGLIFKGDITILR